MCLRCRATVLCVYSSREDLRRWDNPPSCHALSETLLGEESLFSHKVWSNTPSPYIFLSLYPCSSLHHSGNRPHGVSPAFLSSPFPSTWNFCEPLCSLWPWIWRQPKQEVGLPPPPRPAGWRRVPPPLPQHQVARTVHGPCHIATVHSSVMVLLFMRRICVKFVKFECYGGTWCLRSIVEISCLMYHQIICCSQVLSVDP